jgi:hypothetical protein
LVAGSEFLVRVLGWEILFQQAIYCGVPAANHAFALTPKVLDAMQQASEPSPQQAGPG